MCSIHVSQYVLCVPAYLLRLVHFLPTIQAQTVHSTSYNAIVVSPPANRQPEGITFAGRAHLLIQCFPVTSMFGGAVVPILATSYRLRALEVYPSVLSLCCSEVRCLGPVRTKTSSGGTAVQCSSKFVL
jgi:hypothetical protein